MQVIDPGRDGLALEVNPGTLSNSVARVDCRRAVHRLGAEIRAPGLGARPGTLRQRLAMLVGALQAAEIGAFAQPGAGDEEAHVRGLGLLLLRLREIGSQDENRGGGRD